MMKGEEELKSEENETQKELKREEEQETAEEDEGRVRMAPNMGAGGSHPQATTDPEEKQRQGGQWVLRPTREWRNELSLVGKWADCVDEEPEEEAEEEDKHEAEDEREEEEAEVRENRGSEGREEEVKGEEKQ